MSVLDSLRNGFKVFLLSMGVSAPAKKPQPTAKSDAKPESRRSFYTGRS
ncbi:MAG: hypothetical protein ABR991_02230 [Terracidiphilus sp.]|jgi:hypothetical protein